MQKYTISIYLLKINDQFYNIYNMMDKIENKRIQYNKL